MGSSETGLTEFPAIYTVSYLWKNMLDAGTAFGCTNQK